MSIDSALGDCLEVLKDFCSKNLKVDAIIADIPYNISIANWGEGFDLWSLIPYVKDILKENGNIVPWSSEKVAHPTQKPLNLMERCVNIWSNVGDAIIDFAMGSGTVGVACKKLKRNLNI